MALWTVTTADEARPPSGALRKVGRWLWMAISIASAVFVVALVVNAWIYPIFGNPPAAEPGTVPPFTLTTTTDGVVPEVTTTTSTTTTSTTTTAPPTTTTLPPVEVPDAPVPFTWQGRDSVPGEILAEREITGTRWDGTEMSLRRVWVTGVLLESYQEPGGYDLIQPIYFGESQVDGEPIIAYFKAYPATPAVYYKVDERPSVDDLLGADQHVTTTKFLLEHRDVHAGWMYPVVLEMSLEAGEDASTRKGKIDVYNGTILSLLRGEEPEAQVNLSEPLEDYTPSVVIPKR